MIVLQTLMLVVYLFDLNQHYEGIAYVVLVILTFVFMRVGNSISYFFIEANKKATSDTQDAIGILTNNSLLLGISIGNIGSNLFPLIYRAIH